MDALAHIEEFIGDMDGAATLDHAFLVLRKQVERLGFEMFSYWLLWPPEGPRTPLYVTSYPASWTEHYLKSKFASDDMTGRHAAKNILPFLWDDVFRSYQMTKAQKLVFHDGHDAGLKIGASVPIHGPGAAKASFSVSNSHEAADFQNLFIARRHELHLLATYAHERILKLGLERPIHNNLTLTPREIEVLTWTARGKTRWEIGEILNLSEETVKKHLVNACQRLGATNKTHATATAIIHNLILP